MRVAVVHNAVGENSAPDDQDVLVQADAVLLALKDLGHEASCFPCTLALERIRQNLKSFQPDVVFNLVESLAGQGRLIGLFPALLETMGVPYTGSCADAIVSTSNKITAKKQMVADKLTTPLWLGPYPPERFNRLAPARFSAVKRSKWLIKSVWEHASIGMNEDALIVPESVEELEALMKARLTVLGGSCFAEAYVEGREFNLSLLASPAGPEVLPPAEIIFEGYGQDKPRIVGYRAKWDPQSYEYHHTPRCFSFTAEDEPLIQTLKQMAVKCWHLFGLDGYARVDFRVDPDGNPWILEINANPCLSPDAGFAAALDQAGLGYSDAVRRILENALTGKTPVDVSPIEASDDKGRHDAASMPAGRCTEGIGLSPLVYRYEPEPEDTQQIRGMVRSTAFFRDDEVEVAVELIKERLEKGPSSGYYFVFALQNRRLIGYSCYGPIACTISSHDLFWIVVLPEVQKEGFGRSILAETERQIRQQGGTRVYVETSMRSQYDTTRIFYERCGYRLVSVLDDFYDVDDDKATYCKIM